MSRKLLIFAVLMAICHAKDEQYCSICKDQSHTLCKFEGRNATCDFYDGEPLTNKDKKDIVKIHNDMRREVARGDQKNGKPGPQPDAADMKELKWDDEIAKMAQMWVNQCRNLEHDSSCRKVQRFKVGQNLYIMTSPDKVKKVDLKTAIQSWYNEVNDFNKNDVNSFKSTSKSQPIIGHYTQLVWANSTVVGCGVSYYMAGEDYKILFGCNYGAAGNMVGTPIYKTGDACSKCPGDCKDYLCV